MSEQTDRRVALERDELYSRIDTLEEQLAANSEELAEIRDQLKADKLKPLVHADEVDPKEHPPIAAGRKPDDFVDSNPVDYVEPKSDTPARLPKDPPPAAPAPPAS
jgi:hypothetical protein